MPGIRHGDDVWILVRITFIVILTLVKYNLGPDKNPAARSDQLLLWYSMKCSTRCTNTFLKKYELMMEEATFIMTCECGDINVIITNDTTSMNAFSGRLSRYCLPENAMERMCNFRTLTIFLYMTESQNLTSNQHSLNGVTIVTLSLRTIRIIIDAWQIRYDYDKLFISYSLTCSSLGRALEN